MGGGGFRSVPGWAGGFSWLHRDDGSVAGSVPVVRIDRVYLAMLIMYASKSWERRRRGIWRASFAFP